MTHHGGLHAAAFALYAVFTWLTVTSFADLLSGWFFLMKRFPDRPAEQPSLTLFQQSGSMGLRVGMHRVLRLGACPSGLRVGMNRLLGPFCRTFFVPWGEMSVSRKGSLLGPKAELRFGEGRFHRLTVEATVADQLWRSVPEQWPEAGPIPAPETRSQAALAVLKLWLLVTVVASTFFVVAPLLLIPKGPRLPVVVAILFPAITYGLYSLVSYWDRTSR